MEIIDTHAHPYHPDESAYPMIPDPFRPPPGIGTIEHLRRDTSESGVARAVLIQTGSAYLWDNRLIADTAAANRGWTTAVCNLDSAAPGSVGEFERLFTRFNVRGLRLEPDRRSGAYYHDGSVRLMAAARRLGGVICAHINAPALPELSRLLAEFPDVPVVLDHCAYPQVEKGVEDDVVQAVCGLAAHANLNLKLTFGVTSSKREYPFPDTQPLLRHFVQVYGPDRCMWGSDFPTEHWLGDKCTYLLHLQLFLEELGLSAGEREAILVGTPMRIWFR